MTYPKTVKSGTKPCQRVKCPHIIQRTKQDSDFSYHNKRYCHKKCRVLDKLMGNFIPEDNHCKRGYCNKIIPRRKSDTDEKYNARKFCSTYCAELEFSSIQNNFTKSQTKELNQQYLIQGIKDRVDPISVFLRSKYEA